MLSYIGGKSKIGKWINEYYPKDMETYAKYTKGLNLALHNYLNDAGYQENLQNWFDFPIPKTKHPKNLIEGFLS